MAELTCFKSYDVRGQLGVNLDAPIAYRIGRAFAQVMQPGVTVTGRDVRESSTELQTALIEGLLDGGSDVIDIGLCGTEEVYFATAHFEAGGGLEVTASHNPIDYNGIKMVRDGSKPISGDNGLLEIKALAESQAWADVPRGQLRRENPRDAYADRILSFIDLAKLRPLKILVNAGHGVAGPGFDAIEAKLKAAGAPLEFIKVYHDPDGSFPMGIPNPLLPENQPQTAEKIREFGADFGVAWDGDFDRCFLFDETGAFIDGEYIVGLLAAAFLPKEPGARIVHDPRVMWNTLDVVAQGGGEAVVSRTGHALIKAKMREVDGIYGGEMSAHHYFRNFMYCDSGMVPWLLVAEHMGVTGQSLSSLVAEMRANFPSSGEINFKLKDAQAAMDRVEAALAPEAIGGVDRLDGISMAFEEWRVNLRKSNTEPVLRLNVETRGDRALLDEKVAMLKEMITA
ncbi:MAG: phosphomannomutase [Mangrovicoccus sp.]